MLRGVWSMSKRVLVSAKNLHEPLMLVWSHYVSDGQSEYNSRCKAYPCCYPTQTFLFLLLLFFFWNRQWCWRMDISTNILKGRTIKSRVSLVGRAVCRWNCVPCGIEPTSWLCEMFIHPREERSPSFGGISPESLFCDRSSDSSAVRFAKDYGMCPVKAFLDKLSTCNSFNRPIDSGTSPWILFPEKSMAV